MALILNLETSTTVCSVALAQNGELLTLKELNSEKFSHAENLNLFIEDVLRQSGRSINELNAVAVSEGPGSYTGLRIGTSTAKGICHALEVPLIAVNTLKALAIDLTQPDLLICPMLDARRMEVYASIFDEELNALMPTDAVVIDENSFTSWLNTSQVLFCGPGAEKCKPILEQHLNALFNLSHQVSAKYMVELSEVKFNQTEFVDLAYFEPFYLKEFIAGPSKKLL